MRRTSLVTVLVFVAGLGIGCFARGATRTLQRRIGPEEPLEMRDHADADQAGPA
ncbi:MAG TPA: hypothetical protein VMH03_05905 [Terriglobales bacterium]|nr:hypothetical protein [Terriglobales bacterium]